MKDDIEEIIKNANEYAFRESSDFRTFNRLSSLPSSKVGLKREIKERIRTLTAGYISLASFIDDDSVDFLEANLGNENKKFLKKKSRIYKKAIKEMERLEGEMRKFDPFELPTAER